MGVFLDRPPCQAPSCRLPHARGGVSRCTPARSRSRWSSPRPWGCFQRQGGKTAARPVFPTPVGVFPPIPARHSAMSCLPHARGGVSKRRLSGVSLRKSSPRPWGCFCPKTAPSRIGCVFPTPVGVFLGRRLVQRHGRGLPHARGGVSGPVCRAAPTARSSPRPWGCFCKPSISRNGCRVFPTPVGVFPPAPARAGLASGLPHARGGVSHNKSHQHEGVTSSPRPWGCFRTQPVARTSPWVFPTPVGVFLSFRRRARLFGPSSPRPWGCFSPYPSKAQPVRVFPTPVGVFPRSYPAGLESSGLPHAREGVSIMCQSASTPAHSTAATFPKQPHGRQTEI